MGYDEPMAAQSTLPIYRLDVDTYNRMVDSGALEDLPIELLEGLLVEKPMKSAGHVRIVTTLMRHIATEPRWWMQVQDPIELRPNSEPEPDIVVADHAPPIGEHLRGALLVVEVAVSSQMIDRNVKAALYARGDITTYWIVDVHFRIVEVRTQPGPEGYGRCETYREGDVVPSPLEGVTDLDVSALLADV
jgi:Uma2 family endonuclease